jgi:hypothetical protein
MFVGSIISAISTDEPSLAKCLKACSSFESILAKTEELNTLKAVFGQLLRRVGEKTVSLGV